MKYSELLKAAEDGKEWEWKASTRWWREKGAPIAMAAKIGEGYEIRLIPEKKKVPLGPEDFVGGCWWIRNTNDETGHAAMVMHAFPAGVGIGSHQTTSFAALQQKFLRTNDGKNWVPCEKEVEA